MIDSFRGCRVLVVGDLLLDEYIWGRVRRISPEAPVPVVEVMRRSHVAGGAGNVAANAAGLGAAVTCIGVVGNDAAGGRLLNAIRSADVDASAIVFADDRPTTTKTRVIAQTQQIVRLDEEIASLIPSAVEDALIANIEAAMGSARVCILSDYAKGAVTDRVASRVAELGRSLGVPVLVDPKRPPFRRFRGAALIKPNLHEAELFFGRPIETETDLYQAGRLLAAELIGTTILITRGAKGMMLFGDGEPMHVPAALDRKVFDVTGAGDTVISTLAVALAAGVALPEAARLADIAAGIAISKMGTAVVTAAELREAYRS